MLVTKIHNFQKLELHDLQTCRLLNSSKLRILRLDQNTILKGHCKQISSELKLEHVSTLHQVSETNFLKS